MSETAAERKARVLREEPSPEALKRAKDRVYNTQPERVQTTPAQTAATAQTLRAMKQRLERFAEKLPGPVMPHEALRQKKKQYKDLDDLEK